MKRIIDIDEKDYEVIKRECSNKDVVPIGWVQILNGKPLQTDRQIGIGHWILADEQNEADIKNDNYRYICSECNHSDIQSKAVTVPYCWFCGAKMEGE